eukprot:2523600-Pyramimonas_sp.AAC.1
MSRVPESPRESQESPYVLPQPSVHGTSAAMLLHACFVLCLGVLASAQHGGGDRRVALTARMADEDGVAGGGGSESPARVAG